jgi:predicted nucleotidyltransferase
VFQELLARIARELNASRIPYMVIGGQAVLLYGEPRLTRDIDITLGIGADKYESIMEEQSGIRIDFIFSFSPYEKQAIERSKSVTFQATGGSSIQFATLEDIVIHKVIAGRPRDIEDVKSIILKNPSFDSRYITSWLTEFDKGLDTRYLDVFNAIVAETG